MIEDTPRKPAYTYSSFLTKPHWVVVSIVRDSFHFRIIVLQNIIQNFLLGM